MRIPFNKPYLTGKEVDYIYDAVQSGHISGNGKYTKKCQAFFQEKFGFKNCLLTTSCSDALEMTAILLDIQPGDEVIVPAYTFVSSANAYALRGAKIVFADSYDHHPNIDPESIAQLITDKTKAIVVVHYSGVACDMDRIMEIANAKGIPVVEDAAQAINSYYKGAPLGSIGTFGTFSFHETKNLICGEGGMLAINDDQYKARAEIIWEKGTNRASFFRGEVDKYGWVDIGSSFLPSELVAAFLYAQLENLDDIQQTRSSHWNQYQSELSELEKKGLVKLPSIPDYATNNAHIFYLLLDSLEQRDQLIQHLRKAEIHAVFHYLALHESKYYSSKYDGGELDNCKTFADVLLRLPLYYELTKEDITEICNRIKEFFEG